MSLILTNLPFIQKSKEILSNKSIIIVELPQSRGVLHSYKNIAYKRVGSNDMPLTPEEVIKSDKRE